jgi:hypothetical protein
MDPQEVLRQAREALARGDYTAEEVDRVVAENTEFPNIFALRMAVEAEQDFTPAQRRLNERGGSAAGDFGRMGLKGLMFGFDDEVLGLLAGTEARDRSRQITNDLREANPGAALASEIAGGFLFPAAGARVAAQGGTTMGRAAVRGAAVGGAAGAVSAGLFGAGDSDAETTQERLDAAKTPSLFGGVGGAVTGGAGGAVGQALARGTRGRGGRVADELGELTGLDPDINRAYRAADERIGAVRARFYQPLERQFRQVDDVAINDFITELGQHPDTRSIVRRVTSDLLEPSRRNPGPRRPPSFTEVQEIRTRLSAAGRNDDAAVLTSLMEDAFGDGLREADAAYGMAREVQRQLEAGYRLGTASSSRVDRARGMIQRRIARGTSDSQALRAFDQGRLARIDEALRQRNRDAVGLLRRYMDAGEETQARLRSLFPDEGSFDQFMRVLNTESNRDRVLQVYAALARPAAVGIGVGAGYGTIQSLFP